MVTIMRVLNVGSLYKAKVIAYTQFDIHICLQNQKKIYKTIPAIAIGFNTVSRHIRSHLPFGTTATKLWWSPIYGI